MMNSRKIIIHKVSKVANSLSEIRFTLLLLACNFCHIQEIFFDY